MYLLREKRQIAVEIKLQIYARPPIVHQQSQLYAPLLTSLSLTILITQQVVNIHLLLVCEQACLTGMACE